MGSAPGVYCYVVTCISHVCRWEEELVVDAAHEALAGSDALLLFELLQPPASFTRYKVRGSHCAAPKWSYVDVFLASLESYS